MNPPSLSGGVVPEALRSSDQAAAAEMIDLSGDDPVDVDSFIIDVLLVKVTRVGLERPHA